MRLLRRVLATTLIVFSGTVQASVLPEQLKNELEESTYPLTSIVPGYERPASNAPKFAVAEFKARTDDLVIWSRAIAEILRQRIQYVPGIRLYMPAPYYTYIDAQPDVHGDIQRDDITERPLLTSHIAFNNLNKAMGINLVLTGSVTFDGNIYTLITEIDNVANRANTNKKEWSFTIEELPKTIINISQWVYQSLGVDLNQEEHAYVSNEKSLDRHAIDDFVSHYKQLNSLKGASNIELINQLKNKHPEFILFSMYAIQNEIKATNLDEAYKKLERHNDIRSMFPGHAGLELESYRAMDIGVLPKHIVAQRIAGLKRLVKENPHDSAIMINLGDALTRNGNTSESITVMLEAIGRWPDNYRAWWSMGWALQQQAWQVRGNSMWRDVPENAKTRFTRLSQLSEMAIDQALSLHSYNALLLNMKINTMGSNDGYSKELMNVFDRAAITAPTEKRIYDSALNFASDKWGGNRQARLHIIKLALKNNPDMAWPLEMRQRFISDFEHSEDEFYSSEYSDEDKSQTIHLPAIWKALIPVLFVLTILAVYWLGRKTAESEIDPSRR